MNQGIQNLNKYKLLDWESIRSSPRDGSSISYLWVGLVVVVGWVVDPKDFCVSPWTFENGASSKIDDVLAEDGGIPHVLPLTVHLKF